MGAHSAKGGGRAAELAGRGLLSAAAALALIGGGSGMALAGEASHGSSHDTDHHDKGDKHDRDKGDKHEKDRDKDRDEDRDEDGPDCEVEEPGLVNALLGTPPTQVCDNDVPIQDDGEDGEDGDVLNPELPGDGSEEPVTVD